MCGTVREYTRGQKCSSFKRSIVQCMNKIHYHAVRFFGLIGYVYFDVICLGVDVDPRGWNKYTFW